MSMTRSYGPLLEVARIQSEINRLFDTLIDLGAGNEDGSTWVPNVDILESADRLTVNVELPGVRLEDLRLSVTSGNIILEGEKQRPERSGSIEFLQAERSFGSFRRVIQLGVPVNTRQARATLNQGLLRICFPRVPNRRGEAVPIEVEGE
jgi:HSP20 family protein